MRQFHRVADVIRFQRLQFGLDFLAPFLVSAGFGLGQCLLEPRAGGGLFGIDGALGNGDDAEVLAVLDAMADGVGDGLEGVGNLR